MKKLVLYFSFLFVIITNIVASDMQYFDTTKLYELDEVQITQFYRTSTKTTNVIDRDYLLKTNRGQEPSFILNTQPSIVGYSDTGNEYGYSYFRMRGMDQTRVNMTLDGMPLNEGEDMGVYFSNYPDFLSNVHTIKVDPGASIANNGVSAYAGSIDFESVNLKTDTVSSVFVGYGSHNSYKLGMDYNMGIKKNWGLHIKATTQHSDGYRENAYNTSQSFFVKTGYFFNTKHSIDLLSFVGQSKNGQAWMGSTMEEIKVNPRKNGCTSSETDHFIQNINKLQYKGFITDNITATASVYYNYLKGYYFFDLDNFMISTIDPTWQSTNEIYCYNLEHHMVGGNASIKFYINDFNITSGVNALSFNRNHIGTHNIGPDSLWNNTGYKTDINAFIKLDYTYKGFNVLANAQYRHADFNYIGDVEFTKLNWDFFNWSVQASYTFNNTHKLYASATQTHREPTRTDMFGGEENLIELGTTQAESVIDYEVGYNVTANKINANVNLYYMDFENELILNGEVGTNGLPIRINAANSYRAGIEVSINYNPVKGLYLTNTSTYSINKVKTDTEVLNHVMSPTWIVNQAVSYNFYNFEIGADVRYRSSMYFDLTNMYKLDDSFKVNAYINYTTPNDITLSLSVNNIFNTVTYSNGMFGANGPLYFIDSPRTIYGSIVWKF